MKSLEEGVKKSRNSLRKITIWKNFPKEEVTKGRSSPKEGVIKSRNSQGEEVNEIWNSHKKRKTVKLNLKQIEMKVKQ